jgi:hypothetical protein
MSALDAASQAVFEAAGSGDPRTQVHIATYSVTHQQLADRDHVVEPDADRARILRSVLMKPESGAAVPGIHARLAELAGRS